MDQHTEPRSTGRRRQWLGFALTPVSRAIAVAAGILVAGLSAFADSLDVGLTPGVGWIQRFGIYVGVVLAVWGMRGMWAARR
jgi:hypothetical protein